MLCKLLLCGEDVTKRDLYEQEPGYLIHNLSCDLSDYKQLIHLCFSPIASSPLIAALVRSICIHHFTNTKDIKWPTISLDEQLEDIRKGSAGVNARVDALHRIGRQSHKDDNTLKVVVPLLNTNDVKLQRHVIAVIATLSPGDIQSRVIPLFGGIHEQKQDSNADLEIILKEIEEESRHNVLECEKRILQLSKMEIDDIRVLDKLLEFLNHFQPDYRRAAAKGLQQKHLCKSEKTSLALMKRGEKEAYPSVRMEIVTALSHQQTK